VTGTAGTTTMRRAQMRARDGVAITVLVGAIALGTGSALVARGQAAAAPAARKPAAPAAAAATGKPAAKAANPPVPRGKYLVTGGGCNDCHTPWKMGENGPEPDMTRFLSGHPADMTLPPPPQPSGPWIVSAAATFTAWSGPWGTSYTANL